ncbi:MAG TPA: hypothetical protein VFS55_09495 [Dokdonella sp.]|nr:hypothetical protein [Dokdonella sp.]
MNVLLACVAAALAIGFVFAWRRERRLLRRRVLLSEILDLADALERELLECRARLREVPALAAAAMSPAEQLSARATLAAEPQVQEALRDLLAHRLWLKQHAAHASDAELAAARDALDATRGTLARQLERLADVRADVEQTRASIAAQPTEVPH